MPVVGINPIGFCDARIWVRKDEALYEQYLDKVARFSLWLLEQGYNLRMFTTETSVDKYALEDLKARLCSQVAPDLLCQIFRTGSKNVKDVLREMSEFDFVVTSKYHGIIFSQVLGKPVISLSYHRKMDFAMQAVGQDRFCADIERFSVDWLIESLRSARWPKRAARRTRELRQWWRNSRRHCRGSSTSSLCPRTPQLLPPLVPRWLLASRVGPRGGVRSRSPADSWVPP